MSPRLRFALRLVAGVALVGLILRQVDLSGLAAVAPGPAAAGVAVAAALLLAGQSFAALRWRVILGPGSPPWRYLARLYLIGAFASLFLPTLVGGDALRAAAASRATGSAASAVTSVLLDRLLGVAAMLAYLALGVAVAPAQAGAMVAGFRWAGGPGWLLPTLVIGGIAAAGLALTRSPRVRRAAAEGWTAVSGLARSPARAAAAGLLALVVQGIYLVLWMALARALDLPLGAPAFLVAVPLVTLGSMLPVTLAGLGVREGAWLLLLRSSGIADARVVAFSLLYFVANLVVGAIGGGLFVGLGLEDGARRPEA